MQRHTTILMETEIVGEPAHDTLNGLIEDVITKLDDREQLKFFYAAFGRIEAITLCARPITTADVDRMRGRMNVIIADRKQPNTFPCDCGGDLNDGTIIDTNKVQCPDCKFIHTITT